MVSMKTNTRRLLVVSLSVAATLAASVTTDVVQSIDTTTDPATVVEGSSAANPAIDPAKTMNNDEDDDDDDHFYIPHEGNSTLSATFSIRVTPEHYHMVSWTILWLCFASAVAFGMHQIRLERRWLKHVTAVSVSSANKSAGLSSSSRRRQQQQQQPSGHSPGDPELGDKKPRASGRNYTRSGGRIVRSSIGRSRERLTLSGSSTSVHSSSSTSHHGNLGDEPAVSSGDIARATFRRLLLTAIISRTIAIPIQIYSDPLWLQLIADTFPVMVFATAWTWLVAFFVQLVSVALGTSINANLGSSSGGLGGTNSNNSTPGGGSNPSPPTSSAYRPAATIDTVIQITAFVVYSLLIICFTVFRRIAAAVLLYALLCCVYGTLLGMGLYFCPRLLGLLLPGLGGKWHSPLGLRLVACSLVCLLVFAGHTFSFARKVVQSTAPASQKLNGPYWWFQYGALELIPGLLFLALLHPKSTTVVSSSEADPAKSPSSEPNPYPPPPSGRRTPPLHRRTDSNDSKSGARLTPSPRTSRSPPRAHQGSSKETTALLSSNTNPRYGGSSHTDVENQQVYQQHSGSDRSTASLS